MSGVRKFTAAIALSSLVFGSVVSISTKAVAQSSAVTAEVGVPVEVNRFSVKMRGCEKQATSAIVCYATVTNLAGDREFALFGRGSRIIELDGNELPGQSAELGSRGGWYADNTLISGIPIRGSITFGGVATNVNQVAVLEVLVGAGSEFKLQYRNVPLLEPGSIEPSEQSDAGSDPGQPTVESADACALRIAGLCIVR